MARHAPDDPLAEAHPFQVGLAMPGPLSARLDALVTRLHAAGEHTTRKELIAALALTAPEDETELRRTLRAYRLAEVRDAYVSGAPPETFLEPRRPRGPRRRPPERTSRRASQRRSTPKSDRPDEGSR
jgi:hypothetical protein